MVQEGNSGEMRNSSTLKQSVGYTARPIVVDTYYPGTRFEGEGWHIDVFGPNDQGMYRCRIHLVEEGFTCMHLVSASFLGLEEEMALSCLVGHAMRKVKGDDYICCGRRMLATGGRPIGGETYFRCETCGKIGIELRPTQSSESCVKLK